MESVRIAMVAMDFHREGGSEGRTGHLVAALAGAGHEVHLVGARICGDWDSRVIRHVVPVIGRPKWLEVLSFIRGAARTAASMRCDVIHNQIRPYLPGVVTAGGGCHRFYLERVLSEEIGPVRAWMRRASLLHRTILSLERRRYHPGGQTWVIANSRLNRNGILQYYPIPPAHVRVVYNGVDSVRYCPENAARFRDETRRRLEIDSKSLAVLFVGGNYTRKGLGPLLEAVTLADSRGERLRIVVVGGRPGPRWTRLVTALGLADRVRFVGHVPDPERYYAAADIFVLPTHFDPFANATLEAMASGLPVVTTRQNGVAEIIDSGTNGLVLDELPTGAGLAALLTQCEDGDRRQAMGRAARETALGFPWAATAKATLEMYRLMREADQPDLVADARR